MRGILARMLTCFCRLGGLGLGGGHGVKKSHTHMSLYSNKKEKKKKKKHRQAQGRGFQGMRAEGRHGAGAGKTQWPLDEGAFSSLVLSPEFRILVLRIDLFERPDVVGAGPRT